MAMRFRLYWPSRRRLFALILLCAAVLLTVQGTRFIRHNHSQAIALRPVKLNPEAPAARRVGGLIWLNGWELSSDNERFGGFSALSRLADGRFLLVSDAGHMASFRLAMVRGRAEAHDIFIGALPGAHGTGGDGKPIAYTERDSEGITTTPDRQQYWISYEAHHAVRRLSRSFTRVEARRYPKSMAKWPDNGGAEAIVRLPDGRFLLLSEDAMDPAGNSAAVLFSGDPTDADTAVTPFRYRPPDGYKVTEAAMLSDGRVLLLHRRLGLPYGLSATLTMADPATIRRGAVWRGTPLATLRPPVTVDNMEGLYVERCGHADCLWMVSDDNYMAVQRTLLLHFRIAPSRKAPTTNAVQPGFSSLPSEP